jgi:hypothetical protein
MSDLEITMYFLSVHCLISAIYYQVHAHRMFKSKNKPFCSKNKNNNKVFISQNKIYNIAQ